MLRIINKLRVKIGIDGAIGFTLIARMLQAVGGVITLVFVISYLTKEEQGYYYTFGSILALQIFFELGFSGIIVQYIAHENAKLEWESQFEFSGPKETTSRISSLLRFAVKWFGILSAILFVTLLGGGFLFFTTYAKESSIVEWEGPWFILAAVTALTLFVSPFLAFCEGLGKVKMIAKLRLVQQVVQISCLFLFFIFGFKLYAAPVALFCSFIILPFWFYFLNYYKLLINFWNKIDVFRIDYFKEIFPFQWKIALSWVSGYFIFQLFNPVIFATDGPIIAGQMGMTLTVLNAINALCFSWMSTKVPLFSTLIAKGDYLNLDYIFFKTLKQSAFLNLCCLLIFFTSILLLDYTQLSIYGKDFYNRFLPVYPLLFMVIPLFLNHFISSWATYLRCHKKEPLLLQSICIGILCCLSTFILGNNYGVFGISLGYFIIVCISFVWAFLLFSKCRRRWHIVG